MTERETFLRAFHAARPAATSRALARTGIYERFAVRVPRAGRILDLACGDAHLTRVLGAINSASLAIGIDISPEPGPAVRARAQQLPFGDGAFHAVACHLGFILFDEIESVVGELARVLAPGGTFIALLGGGPTADGADALHAFASLLGKGRAFGDPRSKSEAGWRALFAGWSEPVFERWVVDLSGSFDEVWAFLGASYSLEDHDRARDTLRSQFPGDHVPCTMVAYLATVTR